MDINNFKDSIRNQVVGLMDKHGLQAKLARSIGKKPSFFAELKRGKPVNALHLKAIGDMFGPKVVCEILGMSIDTYTEIGEFGGSPDTKQLLSMASKVLESNIEMSESLSATIRGFSKAVESMNQLAGIRDHLSVTQKKLEATQAEVKAIRTELDAMRQENALLKRGVESETHQCCQKDRRQRQDPVEADRRTGPTDRRRAVNG